MIDDHQVVALKVDAVTPGATNAVTPRANAGRRGPRSPHAAIADPARRSRSGPEFAAFRLESQSSRETNAS